MATITELFFSAIASIVAIMETTCTKDALPTLVQEYKVSTLFFGTGTGPNSVEGT